MRISLIIFVVLLVCSVTFLFCAATAINECYDDFSITEQTLTGTMQEADGLHVQLSFSEHNQLFWTTNYDLLNEDQKTVDFRFFATGQYRRSVDAEKQIEMDFGSGGYGISGVVDLEEEMEQGKTFGLRGQLLRPAADLAERTPAGECRTEIMRMKDYYPYYPIYMDAYWAGAENVDEISAAHQSILNAYFKIPVSENQYLEVTVEKDEEGRVIEIHCNDYYPEEIYNEETMASPEYTYVNSVVLEDSVYLVLSGTADYSEIQGGYGLYRIPISQISEYENITFSEPQALLEVDKIENVFPLDPEKSESYQLLRGVSDREIILIEQKDTYVSANILDSADGRILQTIDLQTDRLPNVWYFENLVILGNDTFGGDTGRLQLLNYQDGVYTLWLDTAFYPLNDDGAYYHEPAFAFDGERFAMAAFHAVHDTSSFRLTVYDQSGLIYAGDHHCSTDDLTSPLYTIHYSEDALQLIWE